MTPNLSIIIVSYNTKDITKKCLETIYTSLEKHPDFKLEIIVLDNASTDGSVEMIQNFHRRAKTIDLKIIESKENTGFGKGNNLAVAHAKGDILLFLNTDTEVIDDAIFDFYTYFVSPQNTFDILGAKLIEKDRITPQPSCGPAFTLPIIFTFLFLRGDYLGITRYSPNQIRRVAWVSGACFMMKKTSFDTLGGFDEGIFMYMEEIDLFHRAEQKNMTIGFYPQARFIHLGSASSQKRTQPILQVYKGYIYFYKKHYSKLDLYLLKILLQLKALGSLAIGTVTNNHYLIETYEKALEIASMA